MSQASFTMHWFNLKDFESLGRGKRGTSLGFLESNETLDDLGSHGIAWDH